MIPCYELIEVTLSDEKLRARPVAWDRDPWDGEGNDKFGIPVDATEFETACPYCANLIKFARTDIYQSKLDDNNIACLSCSAGNTKKEKEKEAELYSTVFKDPIASGLFGEEIDFERLADIDKLLKSDKTI